MKTDSTTMIFGIHAIIETILAGKSISKVFVQKTASGSLHRQLLQLVKQHNIPYSKVPIAKINHLTRKRHQGAVALLCPIAFANLADVIQTCYDQGKTPLVVLLDSVSDVRNLGAIARTALSVGVDSLVIPTHNTASISGDMMKASVGALAHLPVCRVQNLSSALQYLKDSGLQVVACSEKSSKSVYQANFTIPTALLLGGEEKGIAPKNYAIADEYLKIPIYGPISSLNVSVATAIFLYEALRQRL